ncbi:MAG: tetratricopeptide repeat protein [Gammaproteobacteria bacterium]|nr:tetratricopeptide repeat protein [Gammaproteobacteria bacterium]
MSPIIFSLQNSWRNPRQQYWIVFFILSLLSLTLYSPSFFGGFIWDDTETFLNDPSIRDSSYISSYFTEGVASHLEKQGVAHKSLGYYRPLIRMLHFLEYKIFGKNPAGFHAVSIILNLLVVLLAFLVVREVTRNSLVAFMSAMFFAVNPSHVEAVSWAYSDSYLVFSLFCLLSFYFHLRNKIMWSLVSFSTALLAQESAILLPIILVLERYLIADKKTFKDYNFLIPYLVLVVSFLVLRSFAVGSLPITNIGIVPWLNAISTILTTSVKIFFVPDAAIALYHNKPGMFAEISVGQSFIYFGVIGLGLVAAWLWKYHQAWLFWYAWFFVWLLVMFNVGEFAQFYFMDKILYLGSLGFCVLLAKGLLSLRVKESVLVLITVSYVALYFSVSMWRVSYFLDEKKYFEKAVLFSPDFPLLRYSTGMMYLEREEYNKAEKEFNLTVRLDPKYSYAYNNLGNILYMRNDFSGAINSWRRAISADPTNPQPYYNIGATYDRQGDFQQALRYYRQYLVKQPNPPGNLLNRIQKIQNIQH